MAEIIKAGGFSNSFSVSFDGDEYENCHTVSSIHDIGRFFILENWNSSLDQARDLADKVKHEAVLIYLR